ncbi:MAG: outer membrane lipoprotein-sorting protein [Fibrobacterota bacterium]
MRFNSVVIICLILIFSCFSELNDWPSVLKAAKNKYETAKADASSLEIEQKTMTMAAGEKAASLSKIYKKGVKFRMETSVDMPGMPEKLKGMKTTVVFDGDEMWLSAPMAGKQKLPDSGEDKYRSGRDWWMTLSEKGKLEGTEQFGGEKCYKVKLDEDQAFSRLWISVEDLRLLKAEKEDEEQGVMRIIFSDFKKVDGGWAFPYKTEIFTGDQLFSRSEVVSLKVNDDIDDSLFDPAGLEGGKMNMKSMMKMFGQ